MSSSFSTAIVKGVPGCAADGLRTTSATWGQRLYTGHILSSELVEQMTTPPSEGWYGLGTEVGDTTDGQVVVGHHGSTGPYTSVLTVWPQEQVAVAWLPAHTSAHSPETSPPSSTRLGRRHDDSDGDHAVPGTTAAGAEG